ncbi:MAG: hypothetical protein IJ486_04235 [Firmicutes bacterium]|nr:hypothetical protein [Bacillota bacterium]
MNAYGIIYIIKYIAKGRKDSKMITVYRDNEGDYYDSQLRNLGGAKAAYNYVVQIYQTAGVGVEEKRSEKREDYYDYMHEEVLCWKTVTDLIISATGESLCQYVTMLERTTWDGEHESKSFSGNSKYIIVKNKDEWKAPAPQAPAGSAAQAAPKVKIVLNRTMQELNEKYHFGYVNDNSPIWKIWGKEELGEARLSFEQNDLGSLNMFVLGPYTLFPLRDRLEEVCKKKFVCQCSSEMGTQKDGIEFYRRTVHLADVNVFDQTNRNTMIGTSMMSIVRITYIGSGQERIIVYFNQQNPYLEFRVSIK